MSADIRAKVLAIIADHLCVEIAELSDAQSLDRGLGLDSLDVIEILMAMEEEFDIISTPEDDAAVSTVGDIIALVERLVGAKA